MLRFLKSTALGIFAWTAAVSCTARASDYFLEIIRQGHFEAFLGHVKAFESSPEQLKALINYKGTSGRTPLGVAAEEGRSAIFRYLVERGASLEDKNTLLYHAVLKGDTHTAKLLLKRGASPKGQLANGRYLIVDAGSRATPELLQFLEAHGANIHQKDAQGSNVLARAAQGDMTEAVAYLLKRGVDANVWVQYGGTPLMEAAKNLNAEMIEMILDKYPAQVNTQDANGRTALYYIAHRGKLAVETFETIRVLMSRGANPNHLDNEGRTPLAYFLDYWAQSKAESQFLEVLSLLIEKGANPSLAASFDKSPLAIALRRGDQAAVELLLRKGAFVDLDKAKAILYEKYPANVWLYNGQRVRGATEEAMYQTLLQLLQTKSSETQITNAVRDELLSEEFPDGILRDIAEYAGPLSAN